MKELTIQAKSEYIRQVLAFIDEEMEHLECSMKVMMNVDVCVEELFVNVASYAYVDRKEPGDVTVTLDAETDPEAIRITFSDEGAGKRRSGRDPFLGSASHRGLRHLHGKENDG